jgi:succinate dehydrogenase / fumarate reductase, cytochrome b subunit
LRSPGPGASRRWQSPDPGSKLAPLRGLMPMNIIANIFKSSLGKKYIMAVSGFVLFLFVLGHLAGNLQIFLGAEAINRYGHFLQSNPELIWPARVILVVLVLLHIWSAIKLSLENKAARPVPYDTYQPVASSYASRTMLMSGIIVLVFIIYHLLHFTAQVQYINGTGQSFVTFMDPEKHHDIFKMMVIGFSNGWVSAFYILGIGLLCLHLSHGTSSMFQSLGWKNKAYRPVLDCGARALAFLIFLGYISIPVAILLGYGKEALKQL